MAALASTLPSLAERVRPVAWADEQLLPVEDCLAPLLPRPGLVRGTVVGVGGSLAVTSLAVALVAPAVRAGSWVAAVGLEHLGLTAAEDLGLPLERLVLVATPEPARWAATVAALVEGFDVVLAGPPVRVRPPEARRLVARIRERRSLLVQVGWPPRHWPEEPEMTLVASGAHWEGIGEGWGYCRARRVEVGSRGRRSGDRPRSRWLWLPGPDGGIADLDTDLDTELDADLDAGREVDRGADRTVDRDADRTVDADVPFDHGGTPTPGPVPEPLPFPRRRRAPARHLDIVGAAPVRGDVVGADVVGGRR